jgi:hypothetical protein
MRENDFQLLHTVLHLDSTNPSKPASRIAETYDTSRQTSYVAQLPHATAQYSAWAVEKAVNHLFSVVNNGCAWRVVHPSPPTSLGAKRKRVIDAQRISPISTSFRAQFFNRRGSAA